MRLFRKAPEPALAYDPDKQEPAVRKSICTGEMTAGFIDKASGTFHELMLVDRQGLEDFKRRVGTDRIREIY